MTDHAAALSLALDDFLLAPDPHVIAALRDPHGKLPPWARHLIDQLDAAAADTARTLDRSPMSGRRTRSTPDRIPAWVRLGALHTLAAFLLGTADTCLCAPNPSRPQPLVASAWKPGLVTCRAHGAMHRLGVSAAADRTCDGCGRPCDGLPDDPIWPVALAIGALTYLIGVCGDCRWEEHR